MYIAMYTISQIESSVTYDQGMPSRAPYADLNYEWYNNYKGAVLIIASIYMDKHSVLRIAG